MKSDDSDSWEPELLESQLHGHNPENNLEEPNLQLQPRPRGPRRLPFMWSRVISVSDDADVDLGAFSIEEDMRVMADLPKPPPARRGGEWMPLYLPSANSFGFSPSA